MITQEQIGCAHECRFKDAQVLLGRASFAFYVARFLLIHSLSALFGMAQGFDFGQFFTIFIFYPEGFGTGLPGVYVVWILIVIMLYPFFRWVAGVKARNKYWWLRYI